MSRPAIGRCRQRAVDQVPGTAQAVDVSGAEETDGAGCERIGKPDLGRNRARCDFQCAFEELRRFGVGFPGGCHLQLRTPAPDQPGGVGNFSWAVRFPHDQSPSDGVYDPPDDLVL
jgi:hypothetical protein